MEHLEISKPDGPGTGFHVEGFPDAVKVAAIKGTHARRLAHLALHLVDLSFAEDCLRALALGQHEPIRSALWESAIVRYHKCFGASKSRFSLNASTIYASNALAQENFKFFKAMRNKHFVHDENAFSQALPGAIVNGSMSSCKIAKIVTLSARGDILSQDSFTNLRLLIEVAKAWVIREHDALCVRLTNELERLPHQELMALPDMTYSKPVAADVTTQRQQG